MSKPAPLTRREAHGSRRWVPLPPDPAVFQALGGGHTLESAIADIVDNSIDAQASTVRVRFLTADAKLLGIQIRDDGTGMSAETLEKALILGSRREYSGADLGHFGTGLKAASMRHAGVLAVYTAQRSFDEVEYFGMELRPASNASEIGAHFLGTRGAKLGYEFGLNSVVDSSGTVVQWSDIKGASASSSEPERTEWLNAVFERVRFTLGLVFHKLVENGDLTIHLDIYDVEQESSGAPRAVSPVNPFAYHLSGHTGFPAELNGRMPDGRSVAVYCHILPPKGHDRLPGKKEDWQGLYVYRNNRLLTHAAGWQGLVVAKRELRLARVELNLTDDLLGVISPTPEKNGVYLHPDALRVIEHATNREGNLNFGNYLETAISVWKVSNKRSTDKPVTQISVGLPRQLISAIGESFGWRAGKEPIDIVWRELGDTELFKVDLGRRELQINEAHSKVFGGEESASASIFTTLLFLLTEANFTRESHLNASTFEYLQQIETALLAAISIADEKRAVAFRGTPSVALNALLNAQRGELAEEENTELQSQYLDSSSSREEIIEISPTVRLAVANDPGELSEIQESGRLVSGDQSGTQQVLVEEISNYEPAFTAEILNDLVAPENAPVTLPPMPTGELNERDLETFNLYCTGLSLAETVHGIGRSETDVVRSLATAFFGEDATDDDASLARFHGMPYTPEERERILHLYHGGKGNSVVEIAQQVGRTPFAVAWRLLDHPKRPIPMDKRVRRSVRRRVV